VFFTYDLFKNKSEKIIKKINGNLELRNPELGVSLCVPMAQVWEKSFVSA
jgi:hypothetical protein